MTTPVISELEFLALPDEQQTAYLNLLEEIHGGESLRDFMVRVAPNQLPPRHLDPLIALLERCRRGRVFACLSMPPRHAKTVTIRKAIAWWLTHYPSDTCAYISYSDGKAWAESRKIREIARTAGIGAGEIDNMSEWRTTQGGGLIAAGAGGGMTGKGVQGLMVVDDPYKNGEEADSPLLRERIREWFGEVIYTRLEGASVIVVHTRWREDDLIGYLSKDLDWELLNLPAIADEHDTIGRKPGEALWPERFDAEELSRIRKTISDFSFSALYQGQPRARGQRVFGEPTYYDPARLDLTGAKITIVVDPAASEKTSGDFSVIGALATWGRGHEMTGKVLEVDRAQREVPKLVDDIRSFRARNGGGRVGVESVGGFKAIPQMLKAIDPSLAGLIDEIVPIGDKFTRAQPASAAWNDGRIQVPLGASWVSEFLAEVTAFTGVRDKRDDQVDFLAHAWNQAARALPELRSSPKPLGTSRYPVRRR